MKSIYLFTLLSIVGYAGVLEAMEEACERNVAEACYTLGSLYEGNDGIPADELKLAKYLSKGCELNHDKSCLKLKKHEMNSVGKSDE